MSSQTWTQSRKRRSEERALAEAVSGKQNGGSSQGRDVAQHRKETENPKDPRGQFGSFLRHWLDRQADRKKAKARIAEAAGVTARAVGKWEEGVASPPLQSLDAVAKEMGFAHWGTLAMAAVRHSEQR